MSQYIINISYLIIKRKNMAYMYYLLGYLVNKIQLKFRDIELKCTSNKQLIRVIECFKYHSYMCAKTLIDLVVYDEPGFSYRFTLNYCFLSVCFNVRWNLVLKLKSKTIEFLKEFYAVSTVTPLYKSAAWIEREAWDMYGINFLGNNDLRRILTDYGFKGYPLRKDFPLWGFVEVYYNLSLGDIAWKPVTLTQAYKNYNYRFLKKKTKKI